MTFAGTLAAQTNPQSHFDKSKQPTIQQERGTEKAPIYIKVIEADKNKAEPSAKSEIREERNLTGSWDWSVISTILTAIATAVIALLTISLAVSTKRLWAESKAAGSISLKSAQAAEKAANSAEHSVHVSREAYISSERPWVSVDAVIGSNLLRTQNDINFDVHFTVKNHGKSPAINVHVFYEVVTLKLSSDPFGDVREKISRLAIADGAGVEMGIQLFPSESKVIRWRSPLTTAEISKATASLNPPLGLLPSFYVIGSVFYQSPFDEKIRQTGFNYYVCFTGNPHFPEGSDIPDFSESLPMEQVRLEPVSYSKGALN